MKAFSEEYLDSDVIILAEGLGLTGEMEFLHKIEIEIEDK